jgi:hypothetical protein
MEAGSGGAASSWLGLGGAEGRTDVMEVQKRVGERLRVRKTVHASARSRSRTREARRELKNRSGFNRRDDNE